MNLRYAACLPAGLIATLALFSGSVQARETVIHQTVVVRPFRLDLRIGPPEQMLERGQTGTGEIMVSGRMGACHLPMPGMVMEGPTCNHHVELHVYQATTGTVVTGAHVSITLRDNRHHQSLTVPIMVMMSQTEGRTDLHYGNNIFVRSGSYQVTVTVNSVRARFLVRLH